MRSSAAFKKRRPGRARARKVPGVMNGLESSFVLEWLEPRRISGEIERYDYEKITFKLADRTTWTPDFDVIEAEGYVTFYETKGGWFTDAARVKTKTVAAMWPQFKFVLVRRKNKKAPWEFEEVPA